MKTKSDPKDLEIRELKAKVAALEMVVQQERQARERATEEFLAAMSDKKPVEYTVELRATGGKIITGAPEAEFPLPNARNVPAKLKLPNGKKVVLG